MHPRLLEYYNRELIHLRDMGAEFASEFPKVAGRLGMEGLEVADPYVERLMEGFAFIAARINLKLDAEFPRFAQHLLEMVYPHYLSPTPSCAVIAMQPNFAEGALAAGVRVPRGSKLRSLIARGEQTACEFRTAHEVTLYPIELTAARYFLHAPDLPLGLMRTRVPIRSGLRLKMRCHGGLKFSGLNCDDLTLHLSGADDLAIPLYELALSQCLGVMIVKGGTAEVLARLDADAVTEVGFSEDESLIPYQNRSFRGYRLLQEYFAFPQRFLFLKLAALATAFASADCDEIEIVLLFGRSEARLEPLVDASQFALYATPVINLFERRADRLNLNEGEFEHHLVVDRARPLDYEVFSVSKIVGFGHNDTDTVEFMSFYDGFEGQQGGGHAYFTSRREPRLASTKQQQGGGRTQYAGSEIFLSLVDSREAPYPQAIRQLGVEVLATNRDLPLLLPVAAPNLLTLEMSAPVTRVTLVRGPTRPRSGIPEGEYAWRLVNHLSLNYLSLLDDPVDARGATALRELLELYANLADPSVAKQVEALRSVSSSPVIRRLPLAGPIAFGRGLRIDLNLDESGFAGAGGYLLGSVLEKFFARYVSINSFTQTRLTSDTRGEICLWPARIGLKTLA